MLVIISVWESIVHIAICFFNVNFCNMVFMLVSNYYMVISVIFVTRQEKWNKNTIKVCSETPSF